MAWLPNSLDDVSRLTGIPRVKLCRLEHEIAQKFINAWCNALDIPPPTSPVVSWTLRLIGHALELELAHTGRCRIGERYYVPEEEVQ